MARIWPIAAFVCACRSSQCVDGLDRAAQRHEVRVAGGEELGAAAAEDRRSLLVIGLLLRRRDGERGSRGVAQGVALAVVEPVPRLAVGEQHDRARPQVHVGGEAGGELVVFVAGDRADLLLDSVVRPDVPCRRDLRRACAERAQRPLGHLGALVRDRRTVVVLGSHERCDAERLAHRTGEDADADEADRLEPFEHLRGERALEHLALERVVVDQQRGMERVEGLHADVVEGPRSRPAEGGPAGGHVADDAFLEVRLPLTPRVLELDPQRPAAETFDRRRERLQAVGVVVAVGERQHGRVGLALSARLVGAAAPGDGDGDESRRERCAGCVGTHLGPPGSVCPEATSRRRDAHRGPPRLAARVCPEAGRVGW